MTLSIHGSIPARTLLRLAGLVMVLIGLFGMQGLACHGTASTTGTNMMMSVPASAQTTAVPASGSVGHSLVGGATIAASALVSAGHAVLTSADRDMPGDMGMNMAGLCVAILLIGVAGLILLLNRSPRLAALWRTPRLVALLRPLGREPAPPSLTALSVQRC